MTTYRDYTDEEIERRGEAIYAERIRPLVEADNRGKCIAIDVESGEWRMGEDILRLARELHAKRPEAPVYTVRVGYEYVERLGFRIQPDTR